MSKIITTKEVLYDNRSNKVSKLMFEMTAGNQVGDSFPIRVQDYTVTETEIEGEVQRSFKTIEGQVKDLQMPVDQINQLYAHVATQIPANTPYNEARILEKELAFLIFVQTDIIPSTGKLIYGLEPENFEIYRD